MTALPGHGGNDQAELLLSLVTLNKPPIMIGESQQWTFAPAPSLVPHGRNGKGVSGSAWRLDKLGTDTAFNSSLYHTNSFANHWNSHHLYYVRSRDLARLLFKGKPQAEMTKDTYLPE